MYLVMIYLTHPKYFNLGHLSIKVLSAAVSAFVHLLYIICFAAKLRTSHTLQNSHLTLCLWKSVPYQDLISFFIFYFFDQLQQLKL